MLKMLVPGALLIATHVANAQAVLENSQLRVELIGLKRWTVPMIQDSLRRYSPNDSLLSHACAAVLREKLGFADASVVYYMTADSNKQAKTYLAVTVIEPQDSGLIRYRGPFADSLPDRPDWVSVRRVFKLHSQAFQRAVQTPQFLFADKLDQPVDSTLQPAMALRRFRREHRTRRDRDIALATLTTDRNWQNRLGALVVLSNFADNDTTWWALADALRDPIGPVSSTATQLLSCLRRGAARRVNWAPAIGTLRALLDGTDLFAHNEVMAVLTATQVDTALARPLLKDGGDIILAKLRSHGPTEGQAARRFLVAISGRDLGDDADRWQDWLRSL